MLSLGPLAFLHPWLLAPLIGLPVLWWLLRLTPPAPKTIDFPAVRLLLGIRNDEQTPEHTPWWLLLLRILIVILILAGLARPVLNPSTQLAGHGDLVLLLDDGWSAGPVWPGFQVEANKILAEAERNNRPVRLIFTSEGKLGEPLRVSDAREQISQHVPRPWPVDRQAAAQALSNSSGDVFYFSDGVDSLGSDALFSALAKRSASMVAPAGGKLPTLLLATEGATLALRRAGPLPESTITLRATAHDGRLLTSEVVRFAAGQSEAKHTLQLPAELRNAVTRVEVEGERSAGAVLLLDEFWRRHPVGVVAGAGSEQPFLGSSYYINRALQPFAEIRSGTIKELLEQGSTLLVLADVGTLSDDQQKELGSWIEQGGVLLRFAGPNLANSPDALLPVKLRAGERQLGGAMSWEQPQPLKGFPPNTPLSGLPVPNDLLVRQQVLAEPSPDLAAKVWATLADGTPLVTGEARGKGWVILVHTTANADWSNLPLSGLFVDILRRSLQLSQGQSVNETSGPLPPSSTLDGYGQLLPPPASAEPVEAKSLTTLRIGPAHPPGYYGSSAMQIALNLSSTVKLVTALPAPPADVHVVGQQNSRETELMPYLIAAALALLTFDLLIALRLRGLLATLLLVFSLPVQAQEASTYAADTWLAYVRTGDYSVDSSSEAGLRGLRQEMTRRTSVEPAGVAGIDLETDDITLFPLLYWPVTSGQDDLSVAARNKVNAYLQHGGMIIFDTQDGSDGRSGNYSLQRLTSGLDLPPLAPVGSDHVLTRAFYLLDSFPGRLSSGTLWVDSNPERRNDSVSGIIVGSNDWAAAWSIGDNGRPLFPLPDRQREMARRVGVNMVLYALAGNYKSDQLHVNSILERLGRK